MRGRDGPSPVTSIIPVGRMQKPVGRRGGIVIVALRRIEPGEEITYDYGRDYVKYFLENGGCHCAACRRKRALRRRRNRRRK
jgi:SET domain-containing protein